MKGGGDVSFDMKMEAMPAGRQGFSLIEILIVMAILVILMTIMAMTINPIAMRQKAGDARMKKDLQRIKVAFEEYRSDKKRYPNNSAPDYLLTKLMTRENCGTGVFAPWLVPWPCDSNGNPYAIRAEDGDWPRWFKVVAKLDNEKDGDIPVELRSLDIGYNYGVSSDNILWFSKTNCRLTYTGDVVNPRAVCYTGTTEGCRYVGVDCSGSECNVNGDCLPACWVPCCGAGCRRE